MIFLVEFSRSNGLLSLTEFDDNNLANANAARAAAIMKNLTRLGDVEIALFQTEDLETLKKTHTRYFSASHHVGEDLIEQLRKTIPQ